MDDRSNEGQVARGDTLGTEAPLESAQHLARNRSFPIEKAVLLAFLL
jgi:hypothetical protein